MGLINGMLEFFSEWILLILPLLVLQFVLFIAALVSVLKKDVRGTEKLPWILLIILINTFGPIIYFIIGSGKLDEKTSLNEGNRE